jgi:hypothetical protein
MDYKIVKDRFSGYNVMYKKNIWRRWKYCRAPAGPAKLFQHIWRWDTEKGAQAFINQQLKDER